MVEVSQSWIANLTGEEAARSTALIRLRELLLQRLQKAFRDRPDFSTALLEDIVQDALLRITSRLDQFEGRSQFTTWATTIAIRIAYSELRKRKWKDVSLEQLLADDAGPAGVIVDERATADEMADRRGLVEAMYQVIDERLTTRQKDALLAELKGMPLEEVARRMGSNRNATYKLTHDARKKIKQHLEEAGYSSEDWYSMSR